MGYVFIRLFWSLWILITVLCVLSMLSRIIFSQSLKGVGTDLAFIALWPLTIFSKEGRSKLIKKLKEYK